MQGCQASVKHFQLTATMVTPSLRDTTHTHTDTPKRIQLFMGSTLATLRLAICEREREREKETETVEKLNA